MLQRAISRTVSSGRRSFQTTTRVLAEDAAAGAEATQVTLNFAVPHESIYSEQKGTNRFFFKTTTIKNKYLERPGTRLAAQSRTPAHSPQPYTLSSSHHRQRDMFLKHFECPSDHNNL